MKSFQWGHDRLWPQLDLDILLVQVNIVATIEQWVRGSWW
jgi:hypothetical protein